MRWFAQFGFRLRSLFSKRKLDEQLSEEIRTHVEMATEANIATGMTPDEARYAAMREFGNVAGIQERAREGRGWVWLEQMGQDVRYALRQLRRNPGFAAVAICSLALGIGANTAMFSLIDEVLLRSLPVKDPDRLVVLRWLSNALPVEGMVGSATKDPVSGLPSGTQFSYPLYGQLRDRTSLLDEVFAFAPLFGITLTTDTRADRSTGQLVTGNYYSALGVSAWRGRTLNPEDDRPGAEPVVVIGYRFWRQNLGADKDVVGRVIRINQQPFTVVGITPRDFLGTLEAGLAPDVTVPLCHEPRLHTTWTWMNRPHIWWLHVMGRLKPGVTTEMAGDELKPVFLQTVQEARKLLPARRGSETIEHTDVFRLETGRQGLVDVRRSYEQPLIVLQAIVGAVLLLACLNMANLLLARGLARHKEIALRLSLGATSGRIARQLLVENTLLALIGGAAGLLVAWWGRQGLLQLWSVGDSRSLFFDLRLLGFSLGLSLVVGLVFGLIPAWRLTRVSLNSALKGEGRAARSALRGGLTVIQVALSMVLLIGAGLFIGTLRNLRAIDTGVERTNLLRFELNTGDAGYTVPKAAQLFALIRARIAALPGVQSAGYAGHDGISPDFRRTMGLALVAGRDLTEQDGLGGPAVALVNEALAKAKFPGVSPIGQRYRIRGSSALRTPDREVEIVGVIGNMREGDVRRASSPKAFVPFSQDPLTFAGAAFCVRASDDPGTLGTAIRRTVREIEPAIVVDDLRTEEQQVNRLFARERLFAVLSLCFGGLALVLTCIGLYGLLAHEVIVRTKEIGIRIALGSQQHQAVYLMMRSGWSLALLGCLLGIVGSLAAARLVGRFLYGIEPMAPGVIWMTAVLLLAVTGIACWLPARRAAKIDPMIALRAE